MSNPVFLETPRLILRPFETDDFAAVHSWASDPESVRFMLFGPNTEQETRDFIKNAEAGKIFAVTIKESGAVIGSCGIFPDEHSDTGQLSWILHRDYRGKGYGTEISQRLIKYGFEDIKLRRITSYCAAMNTGSHRIMERGGMQREATRRKAFYVRADNMWVDSVEYAILAEDYFVAPLEKLVRPIDESNRRVINEFLDEYWHGASILIRGELIDTSVADGFAIIENGKLAGVVTYVIRGNACEIVSLNSLKDRRGVGTILINAVIARARELGLRSVQLITTNDNINAIGFYQKRGFNMVGFYPNAIDKDRELKPDIPLIGQNGIPLRHELDFCLDLAEDPV